MWIAGSLGLKLALIVDFGFWFGWWVSVACSLVYC